MGVPPPGGGLIVYRGRRSVLYHPHTSNDFQSDINWPLLAAAGVSSSDPLVKGELGNYLNPHLLTEVNSVLSHHYCHDRDSTDP